MKQSIGIFIFIGIMCFFSCKKENRGDCFTGTGETEERQYMIQGFHTIQVYQKINVQIRPGWEDCMFVYAGSKLIDKVNVSITDSVLSIKDDNRCNWTRSFENKILVVVASKNLKHVIQFGTGEIYGNDTLKAPEFTIDVKNSGNVSLVLKASTTHINNHVSAGDLSVKGISGVNYVYNSGYGTIDASMLKADITFLGNHSTGRCSAYAKDLFEAEITGMGDVHYFGNPKELKQKISGSGQLIKE